MGSLEGVPESQKDCVQKLWIMGTLRTGSFLLLSRNALGGIEWGSVFLVVGGALEYFAEFYKYLHL